MQQLIRIRAIRGRRTRPPLTDAARQRGDVRWGVVALASVLVLAAALAWVDRVDFGARTYTARMSDAGSIRVGDEIRLAGIRVGTVKSLMARNGQVEMRFTVEGDVFVGAQTTLDVRMLTILGGHYVALTPGGGAPLGAAVIPADRVALPYSLPKVFQEAIRPVKEVDGGTLRRNVAALNSSISQSPEAVGSTLTAMESVVDIMNQQNAEISRSLSLADEYLTALNGSKQVLITLIGTLRTLETIVENHGLEIHEALTVLARVLDRLAPLGQAWQTTLKPMALPLADAVQQLDRIGEKMRDLLDSLRTLESRLTQIASPDGLAIDHSTTTYQSAGICVPVPGRVC
ncbi:MlaD family protein [Nocardia gipuzkoensis]|uniref:MlaD family protein n=1 Tax=Nocardia gipuzkoensis TaxID=2749991 RepID=UPI0024551BA3|nr:MlaD family protein [Nocardia gipuzkoensis]